MLFLVFKRLALGNDEFMRKSAEHSKSCRLSLLLEGCCSYDLICIDSLYLRAQNKAWFFHVVCVNECRTIHSSPVSPLRLLLFRESLHSNLLVFAAE